ncbi:MAG TPA: class I SAM-dependent methyltransferase [Streptosporangiaceae bacterium]
MGDLTELAERWRADLAGWAIPAHITAAVGESPWVLPRQVFARRADRLAAQPYGPSCSRAQAALQPSGELMDVGSGAGAACLPLLPQVTALTAVDSDEEMLGLLAQRAAALGTPARTVLGVWPDVAAETPAVDVVTCHHVLYNVPDPVPFLAALTAHARRQVVAEITARHPLTALNPLWLRFHGLARPAGPTADDLLAICDAMGLGARHEAWTRPGGADYASFDELVDVTRRRLCLPPERAGEVAGALREAGIDPERPDDLGSSGREMVTIWWPGTARN